MERLKINSNKTAVLPIEYNGKNYDLKVNLSDVKVVAVIIAMADESIELEKLVAETAKGKDIKAYRACVTEALNKAEEFYTSFCTVVPDFKEATNGQPVRDFSVWRSLLTAIVDLINENDAKTNTEKEAQEESSETLEG